jgi:hypothetical protein
MDRNEMERLARQFIKDREKAARREDVISAIEGWNRQFDMLISRDEIEMIADAIMKKWARRNE